MRSNGSGLPNQYYSRDFVHSGELGKSGHQVGKIRNVGALGGFEPVAPGKNERHPDSSLVQGTLAPSGGAAPPDAAIPGLNQRTQEITSATECRHSP